MVEFDFATLDRSTCRLDEPLLSPGLADIGRVVRGLYRRDIAAPRRIETLGVKVWLDWSRCRPR